jgi:1-acyl-sn-glycerol-3-phosphate acyltransferase
MQVTLFNTPILSPVLRALSIGLLRLMGWKSVGEVPNGLRKYILIAAPHTSNWDFALFVLIVFALRIQTRVLIKDSLFVGPLGWFLKYCGAMPVDRSASGDRVEQIAKFFRENDAFTLLITPEATRSPNPNWKSGFYRMAEVAQVPIIVAYVDTVSKKAGIDHVFYPTGDLDADMAKVKAFYDKQKGLKPHNYAS